MIAISHLNKTMESIPPFFDENRPTPYFLSTTFLQKSFLSIAYLHNHFPNKALLKRTKSWVPSPPFWTGAEIVVRLTKWNLKLISYPSLQKPLCNFSICLETLIGIGNKDK